MTPRLYLRAAAPEPIALGLRALSAAADATARANASARAGSWGGAWSAKCPRCIARYETFRKGST